MSVPFKSKLAYAWERFTHKDRIYSHVIEQRGTAGVIGHPDKHINTKSYLWLKATKIEGSSDSFKLDLCQNFLYARPNWEPIRDDQNWYREFPHSGVYSREQAEKLVKNWEAKTLESENTFPTVQQPFKAYAK